ncbi:MAG: hypothetical protein WCK55_07415 [Verrucomicrobiota bacterium]
MTPKLTISPNGIGAPLSVSGNDNGGSDVRPGDASVDDIRAKRLAVALGSAYMAITCSYCGSGRVIRTGVCGTCQDCGNSEGCG